MYRSTLLALLASTIMNSSAAALASEETADPYQGNLLGSMGGLRNNLSNHGIDLALEYKADFWSVASGGNDRGQNYLDNLDIVFDIDNEKLIGLNGNKARIYFLNNNGTEPNAKRVGSVQGIDNIEVGTQTFKLYEAWVEQSFFSDRLSVLLGLHDLNSEFDVTDLTANFIKPTMQIGQSFAQSGQNGPSIFPTTGLAGRIKLAPTEETYISAAVFEGIPGNPNKPNGTHINLSDDEGMLLIAEAGITPNTPKDAESRFNKFAIGGWSYTKHMDDLVDVDTNGDAMQRRMHGAYFLSSYQFYNEGSNTLGAFFRGGIADGDTAQVDWDCELGVVANGWLRANSEIGIGLSQSHNSDKYVQSASGPVDRNEYSYELYYRDEIIPGLSMQPDFQYVVNPGTDQATKNAAIFGMRIDLNL